MRYGAMLAAALWLGDAHGQVVITADDMPEADTTIHYMDALPFAFDVDATGAGHSWDLSGLEPLLEGADTLVRVTATPFIYQLYFNNRWAFPATFADHATRTGDVEVPMVNVSDAYAYYATTDSDFRNVGYGVTLNGIALPVQRVPVDVIHVLPLHFGDRDSSRSIINLTLPTLGHYGQEQVRHNHVDGYGTLQLPIGSFEVLRVSSRLLRSDTVFVEQFGRGMRLPVPEMVEYKWLAPGHVRALLEVVTIAGVVSRIRYYAGAGAITSVGRLATTGDTRLIFPNPASEHCTVRAGATGRILLYGADGGLLRGVHGIPGQPTMVNVQNLPNGVYTVVTDGPPQRLIIAH